MKTLFTLAFVIVSLSGANAQLNEFLERGKMAYQENANRATHEQIKNGKNTTAYSVGDTKTFWRWNLSVMPPTWITEPATCRAVGARSYVFVADANWGSSMTQDDVDSVCHYLENVTQNDTSMGIVELATTYFGPIPDEIDNDEKVIFFFSALGSFGASIFDGYFSHFNQMTEAEAQLTGDHSNECEMLYMSCHPVNPTSYSNLSVLTHELQHLIHFGQDENEDSWINEGCSEFAMVLFGLPDPITQFPTNPNNNLISWDQQWSDYVQTMLFTTYLAEQFSGPSFITQLVANPLNGVDGINNTLVTAGYMIPFQAIFVNWTIANFISDTSVMNGQYGYQSLDLPAFHVRKYITSYPSSQIDSLNKCAAHYYKLSNNFTNKIKIDFSFFQGGEWALNLITYEGSTAKEVIPFSSDTITFEQPASYSLDHLFLAVTNMEVGMGENKFSFQINHIYPFGIEVPSVDENEFSVYPNPATHNSAIRFSLNKANKVDINIFSLEGKFIKNRLSTNLNVGNYSFDLDIPELEPGIYFITLKTGESLQTRRLVVL